MKQTEQIKAKIDIEAMVEKRMKSMLDMVLNSNAVMNWKAFFNEIASKVAECAYRQGIEDTIEKIESTLSIERQQILLVGIKTADGSLWNGNTKEEFVR